MAVGTDARVAGDLRSDDLIPLRVALDLAVTTLAYLAAHAVRGALVPHLGEVHRLDQLWWVPLIGAGLWLSALQILGLYAGLTRRGQGELLRKVALAALVVAVLLGFVIFAVKAKSFSRPVFALYIVLSAAGVALARLVVDWLVARDVRARRRTIVIGAGPLARQVAVEIPQGSARELVGCVSDGDGPPGTSPIRWLGPLADLPRILDRGVVDEAVIALESADASRVRAAIAACEEVGVDVSLLVPLIAPPGSFELTTIADAPVVRYHRRPPRSVEASIKRIADPVVACLLLTVLTPILVLLGALVRLTSAGPALFVQRRVGLSGREFDLYKFRTMDQRAEEEQAALAPLNDREPPIFKMRDDPRVTTLGRWLRRWSLDELPQLVNVLKGDMSLVGPRPPTPVEVGRYERWQRRRLCVRPGLTGLWQVSGRSDLTFAESMRLDLAYVDQWSLRLDLVIAWRTLGAVLRRRGSY
jgi:exopolysaccharide biosynthesis polyprenyl glycosylphosphotransferase